MIKNKLILHLSCFSRKEMTRFNAYCHSPYFVKHDQVQKLVKYLNDIYPRFDEKKCKKPLLYKKIFGKEAFNPSKLALVFTYAQRCLEGFLAQEQYEEQYFDQKLGLLKGLLDKGQYTSFEKALKKLEQEQAASQIQDSQYFLHNYQLSKQADDYYSLLDRRRIDDSLQQEQINLDYFFLIEKLRIACETRVRQNIMNIDYDTRFLNIVLEEIKNNPQHYETAPAILVYFKIFQMLDHSEEPQYYFEAISYLEPYIDLFSKPALIDIYIHFMNYCVARINRGHSVFLEEIFKLYKAQLEHELLFENEEISEWDYKNIVTSGIRLGELDWVYNFIENYKERLSEESRNNAYRYNLAYYHYEAGNYDEVLALLTQVEYSDLRYNLGAKALLLRTYFDLEAYEALHSLTESFRQYLLRNKLMADNRRDGYSNLFKLTRRVANLRSKMDFISLDKRKKELQKLEEEIKNTKLLYNRDWLEEKVASIGSS